MIKKQITERISPTIKAFSDELNKIQETYKVAEDNNKKIQESLNEAKISIEFIATVLSALGDNSKDFDKLGVLANNTSHPYSKISRNLYLSIRNFHRQQKTLPWSYHLFSEEQSKNIDFPTLPFHKFIMWLHRSDPLLHMDLIGKILGRPDIHEKKKISFLIKVLRKSNNLKAKNRAGTLFEEKTGTSWDPFLCDPLYRKWDEIKYPAK